MDIDYVIVPALVTCALALIACGALWQIVRLRRAGCSRLHRWTQSILLWPVALVCIALAGTTAFNAIALFYYRHPPPGKLYRVNGRSMRLQCMGQGSPTIVLEAGGGKDGLT